ncbi:alkaline phosphatase PhoX [Meiothermus rufus]|uniref:alkaline phosphatase PhoX n=1 Tax=Meiothermus rufus TaxID=604332 RepID=UPI0004087EF1|nr:alkaline phosphatase PhoX [Meiothermus rufus]
MSRLWFLVLGFLLILALTACPSGGGSTPTLKVTPPSATVTAGGAAIPFSATLTGASGTIHWSLSPASGSGTLSASSGPTVQYTPPASVSAQTSVTLAATSGSLSASASITINPAPGPAFSVVETIAGQTGVRGGADGPGASATFNYPYGVAVTKAAGATGNEVIVYIAGLNDSIRYAQVGYAGNPVGTAIGKGTSGSVDGDANTALVRAPKGIAIGYDSPAYEAYAYWTEDDSCVVRKLTAYPLNGNRKAVTVAGKAYTCGAADGTGAAARFNRPRGVVVNTRTGEVFVADTSNYTIRRIYGDSVSTIAGLAGQPGSADGPGATARFSNPTGLALNRQGDLLVADGSSVRKITAGVVSTLAGKPGEPGYKDGPGSEARFNGASGIAVDEVGNVYVSETGNHTIRKITPEGVVSTVAGVAGVTGADDGSLSVATFNTPTGLAYYNKQLFVADTYNQTIRRIR